MKFLEKDLERILFEAECSDVKRKGLPFVSKAFRKRQLKIGNYGIVDLITVKTEGSYPPFPFLGITIYELKQDKVTISAFLQAVRYCKGIRQYLNKYRPELQFSLNIVLIGREVDTTSDLIYLTDLVYSTETGCGYLESLEIYTYDYDIDGIKFIRHHDYCLTNEGF